MVVVNWICESRKKLDRKSEKKFRGKVEKLKMLSG